MASPHHNSSIHLRRAIGPGPLSADDFEIRTSELAPLADGHIRLRAKAATIDAGTRAMMDPTSGYVVSLPPGEIVPMSAAVGEVTETRHRDYHVGETVRVFMVKRSMYFDVAPDTSWGIAKIAPGTDPLLYLGPLGLTGFTAWIGMMLVACPAPGETVLVSAAGGAVGSVAGQLARASGARTIGVAGGAEKCAKVKEAFGFHDCIDYRSPDLRALLESACPDGFDIYFENVGGEIQKLAMELMRENGRIALCGQIAQYGGGPAGGGVDLMPAVTKRLRIEGFRSLFHKAEFPRFTRAMHTLLQQGEVNGAFTTTAGFEKLHEAINSLNSGGNLGQQIHVME